ncbi:trypsin-like peptidase domain-containing protein [Labrys okinawensis]|uniref:trypsin-like peptidase domain-containing protein n=1 Tax=Labrys okinawensis TaxID=346911 RepID=UPI0039BCD86C
MYAVTNRHVVEDGACVIRMNSIDGKKETLETDERDWLYHPDGDDVAVCLISFDPKKFKFQHVDTKQLLTKEIVESAHIGPGDDVFVVGRFVNHEGKQRNNPTVRFGNIAQMPDEPIRVGGFDQESFLVEARSIGGYSGSPVFWHVQPFLGGPYRPSVSIGYGPYLMGIEWGYLRAWVPLSDSLGRPLGNGPPWDRQVEQNSGMMAVVPSWKLLELVNGGEVLRRRQEIENQVMQTLRDNPPKEGT